MRKLKLGNIKKFFKGSTAKEVVKPQFELSLNCHAVHLSHQCCSMNTCSSLNLDMQMMAVFSLPPPDLCPHYCWSGHVTSIGQWIVDRSTTCHFGASVLLLGQHPPTEPATTENGIIGDGSCSVSLSSQVTTVNKAPCQLMVDMDHE